MNKNHYPFLKRISIRIAQRQGIIFSVALIAGNLLQAGTPTVQTSNLVVKNKTCNSITISFNRGNGTKTFGTCRPKSQPEVQPQDGVNYVTGTSFGTGADLGKENYATFYTSYSQVTINNLKMGESYTFQLYEWDSASKMYLTTIDASLSDSTHFLKAQPTAIRLGTDSCSGRAKVIFKANVASSFPSTSYIWNIGGAIDSSANDTLVRAMSKGGIYSYGVRVFPSLGCYNRFDGIKPVLVVPRPKANPYITPAGTCLNNNIGFTFDDYSTMDPVPRCAYIRTWDFGDGTVKTIPAGSWQYATAGYYQIVFVVEALYDGQKTGCSDTVILKKGTPGFQFPTYPCLKPGDSLKITAPISTSKYTWNNGDTGSFIWVKSKGMVSLTVGDSNQCSFTDSVNIIDCAPSQVRTLQGKNSPLIITTSASAIGWNNVSFQPVTVSVFTPDGRKIMVETIDARQQKSSNIRAGNYIIGNIDIGYQWYLVP